MDGAQRSRGGTLNVGGRREGRKVASGVTGRVPHHHSVAGVPQTQRFKYSVRSPLSKEGQGSLEGKGGKLNTKNDSEMRNASRRAHALTTDMDNAHKHNTYMLQIQ